jgi:hypothetical protein
MGEQTGTAPHQEMDLDAMRTELTERAHEAMTKAADFAREKPHMAVGIALGVGWVLGNGLPPRLVMTAARLGWKAMLGSAIAGSGLAGILREATGVELPNAARQDARGTTRGSSGSSKEGPPRSPRTPAAAKD